MENIECVSCKKKFPHFENDCIICVSCKKPICDKCFQTRSDFEEDWCIICQPTYVRQLTDLEKKKLELYENIEKYRY
jgi:multimeric flavodoxin WrbA